MTSTTSSVMAISTFAMLLGIILMVGSVRGAILLIKDAMTHKKFAKVIRRICAIILFLSIIGSIVTVSIVLANPSSVSLRVGYLMTALIGISMLSIITNIRGGILLFIQSGRVKGFAKWIRIICGVIMIVSLFSSFMTAA